MFFSGEFKEPALPEADITAFARDVQTDPGYLITAMWTGQNQVCTSVHRKTNTVPIFMSKRGRCCTSGSIQARSRPG